MSSQIM